MTRTTPTYLMENATGHMSPLARYDNPASPMTLSHGATLDPDTILAALGGGMGVV